jgi:hypothetical protein
MIDGRKTPYNSTYPKGGVSCSADTFVVAESSVLRMKFSGKNPALRVAAKRWQKILNSDWEKNNLLEN